MERPLHLSPTRRTALGPPTPLAFPLCIVSRGRRTNPPAAAAAPPRQHGPSPRNPSGAGAPTVVAVVGSQGVMEITVIQ